MPERVSEPNWSMAMTLAWITYRTERAVINIKYGRWTPTKAAIGDLLSALRSGRLVAHGMVEGDRIPRPIETAVWSTFEIVVSWPLKTSQSIERELISLLGAALSLQGFRV